MPKKRVYQVWSVGEEPAEIGYMVTVRNESRNGARLAFWEEMGFSAWVKV